MRGDRSGGLCQPGPVLQETWTWSYSKGSFVGGLSRKGTGSGLLNEKAASGLEGRQAWKQRDHIRGRCNSPGKRRQWLGW